MIYFFKSYKMSVNTLDSRYYWERCENCGQSIILCRKYKVQPTPHYRVRMSGTTRVEYQHYCQSLPQPKSSKLACDKAIWAKLLK